ncbi:endopeptidase, putative [Plasmodium ovale wallikeri]|uniref:Endopeptidase, putative n=2 Tax=Plasmodium ovale TaxID=36330 RepID=A0A1C3KV49_PLAOA|nr:endopeptidase, putative [Plasmodium ovale wallikeri]SBT78059.1 endopeptidase, putative [Plasmodium ovale]
MNCKYRVWLGAKRRGICWGGVFLRRIFFFDKFSSTKSESSKTICDKIKLKSSLKGGYDKIPVRGGNSIRGHSSNGMCDTSFHFDRRHKKIDTLTQEDVNEIEEVLRQVEGRREEDGEKEGYLLELHGIMNNGENIAESSKVCIETCDDILKSMCRENDIFKIINMVDTVSNNLCKLGDALELLRNLHNNKEVIAKAHEALERLTDYIDKINIDQNIYNFLKIKYREHVHALDREHREVLQNMILSMENQGVHLKNKKKRKEYLQLQAQEKHFAFHAASNVCTDCDGIYVEKKYILPFIDENVVKDYEQRIMPFIKNGKIGAHSKYPLDEYLYVLQDSPFAMTILENVKDEQVANRVYKLIKKPNKIFLNNILVLQYYRNMLINFRDFKNYNEYALKNCILNTPAKVNYFLENFLKAILPCFFRELQFVERYMEKAMHRSVDGSNPKSCPTTLTPATLFRCMNEIKGEKLKKIEGQMRNHLSLYDVIKFVITLLKNSYSLDMVNILPLKNELWDENILKFKIQKGEHVYGYIYMDLFERENKSHSIAQYTVRCSKNMNSCLKYKWFKERASDFPFFYTGIVREEAITGVVDSSEGNSNGGEDPDIALNGDIYRQTTSTFLVCNFTVDNDCKYGEEEKRSHNTEIVQNCQMAHLLRKVHMSINRVSMFLHEFGHTLHCILSSTYLQHLSGNRSGVDFSEFSSHFFEEYLNSYDSLLLLYTKDESEKKKKVGILISTYLENKNIICYYPLVQVTIQSIIDQIFYSLSHSSNNITERNHIMENEIRTYFLGISYKDIPILDLFPHIHFSKTTHLVHYPSNYYAYLYCSVLSKYIWKGIFKGDSHDSIRANRLVRFLQGGSVDSSLRNIISLVEEDKDTVDFYTENPHQIPLDGFLDYYEEGDKEKKYTSFLQSL